MGRRALHHRPAGGRPLSDWFVDTGETWHATAIVVAETGLLFVGPSGSGKSAAAFACIQAAASRGWNAALVADDRTNLSAHGGRCVASCPEPIRGLLELRGGGIARVRHLGRAVIHLIVAPGSPSAETRLPPENETMTCHGIELPLQRLWHDGASDPLSILYALRRECFFAK
jgi:serine kinase of HPr protein (carbohydrate metabolism regulator)